MQKIMIIEDDPVIRDELALLLANEGYQTVAVTQFANVAMQVFDCSPDLILLDLNLPERDGLSLCADIRRASPIPIIVVTSRDSAVDELGALSLGGDDYITKPYNIPVLLARIKAVLLRRKCGANCLRSWHRSRPMWSGPYFTRGRKAQRRTLSSVRRTWRKSRPRHSISTGPY